jgi:hypothetical protein
LRASAERGNRWRAATREPDLQSNDKRAGALPSRSGNRNAPLASAPCSELREKHEKTKRRYQVASERGEGESVESCDNVRGRMFTPIPSRFST